MKTIILSCLLLIATIPLFGYYDLRVGDPRNAWYTSQGTIEQASLTVRPKGLYMEYGLYLTFSPRGSNWTNPHDTLEVTLRFSLPENAIVTDSWLWIGNDIIKAMLMDKWTASTIYENIVRRRRDPSILFKQSATDYELRVFPMAGNQTRKVKITYLMPVTWNQNQAVASIPAAILNASAYKPSSFPVLTWTNDTWKEPKLLSEPEILFESKSDTVLGNYHEALIPSSRYNDNIRIAFNAPLENGVFFSEYEKDNEGIYQLAIFPNQFFESNIVKKAAILVDYDASNTSLTSKELLSILKKEMLMNLSSKDSFNLIFSNLKITRYSEKWKAATRENIEAAFTGLTNPLSSYSNLGSLVENGIDFIKKNGNNGKVILLSNADQYGEFQVANVLINDIVKMMNPKIPFHIADYQSINYPYYYNNGQHYAGNDYFYINLSRITLGSYHTIRNNSDLSATIASAYKYLGGTITSFDLHTGMKEGFCYSRYSINGASNVAYVNDAIVQVGKFKGEFPFLVEISGEYNNEIFSEVIQIDKPAVENTDTIAEAIWAGQYIKKLESGSQSNQIISEIIYTSLNERVLSYYTSFLCLEDTSYICNNCKDESSNTTGVEETLAGNDTLKVYPNPFVDKLTIELMCSAPEDVKEFSIVDVTGALIYRFQLGDLQQGKNVITW
ncbi:MAG TPA: VIT domain-containing protein, partial [Prolixibacteraceae bacterium]|nr:VIT domain-containing protein [Prolixibacteraceae bacterium]